MPLPNGHRPITLKWVFKLKKDEQGAVIKHKARLVARGFVQQEGIDFDDALWREWSLSVSSRWRLKRGGKSTTWTSSPPFSAAT